MLKVPNRVLLRLFGVVLILAKWAWVEFPDVEHGILSTRDEPTVIIEPADALDWLRMGCELELSWATSRVEFVDPDLFVVLASEQVTSVGEDNLTALLDWDVALVRLETLVKDVHHLDLVTQTDHEVQTAWVERDTVGFTLGVVDDLGAEVAGAA